MIPILIDCQESYTMAVSRGYDPLRDWKKFIISVPLRIEIQKNMFNGTSIDDINQRFYKWVWVNYPNYCEECLKPLHNYSSVHISHILSRGAHPDMRCDPRNVNKLCFACHKKWENLPKKMRIYQENKIIIEILKNDYKNQHHEH